MAGTEFASADPSIPAQIVPVGRGRALGRAGRTRRQSGRILDDNGLAWRFTLLFTPFGDNEAAWNAVITSK